MPKKPAAKKAASPPKRLQRWAFIPDTHRPWHSVKAVAVMMKALRWWKPDGLVIMGDYLDCLAVSFHDKNPGRKNQLEGEIEDANAGLDELDTLGATYKHFICGNHEARLERYIAQKCPELFGLLRLPDMLRLTERGWRWTPYKRHLKLGKLHLSHDFGSAGGTAHGKAINDVLGNAAIGHTHHLGVTYAGSATGESHVGAAFGWLGDVSEIDYMHQAKALRTWHLGFGTGYMEEDGAVHLQAVPIVRGRCVVEGRLFEA